MDYAPEALFEIKNTIEVGIKWQEKNYRLAMLEVNGSGALLNDCKIIQLPADYEVVGFITNVKYKPSKLNTMTKEGDLSLVHNKVSGEVALVEGVVKEAAVFKVGDEIAGVFIKQVRKGTSVKVVVIGRQMKAHVYKVAETIKAEGRYVEVLDDIYLKPMYDTGFEFVIDGKKWTVNSAWDDMVNNPEWLPYKDANGFIKLEHLSKTPMYKVNKMWIEKAKSDGVTIIDIGYPSGHDMSISGFYEMEKSTVIWD